MAVEDGEGKQIIVIGQCVPVSVLLGCHEMFMVIGLATSAPITDTRFLFLWESRSQHNRQAAAM